MIFTRKRLNHNFKIKIGNKYLAKAPEAKYLGVLIDENLTWKPQIQKIESKIASACWMLSKIKRYMSQDVLRNIYFGLVYPHLFYCISCWGAVQNSRIDKLKKLQNRAIRMIGKASRLSPSSIIFKTLNLLKLEDIYKLRVTTIMFKIINGTWVGNTKLYKITELHSYETRYATQQNYVAPKITTEVKKQSFCYKGPIEWSLVPVDIRKSQSITIFKTNYTKYLMIKY
jgi:hypothetical protein